MMFFFFSAESILVDYNRDLLSNGILHGQNVSKRDAYAPFESIDLRFAVILTLYNPGHFEKFMA